MIQNQIDDFTGNSEYCLLPKATFKVKTGPYGRVQNVGQLIEYRDASQANKIWVYSPHDGPFRALGQEKILKILNKESPLDSIFRLNNAMSKLFKTVYTQIESYLTNPDCPAPPYPIVNINKLFDLKKTNLLLPCIKLILDRKVDFCAINRFVKIGGDLDKPFEFSFKGRDVKASSLAYLFSRLSDCQSSNAEIYAAMDRFLELGANLDHTFGKNKDNCVGILIQCLPFESISYILYGYEKYGGNINFKDKYGNTFLHLALFNPNFRPACDINTARALVDHGVDVSESNEQGDHPIHLLCRHGTDDFVCTSLLKAILQRVPAELNARDGLGLTPLYWSIRTRKQLFINTLLESNPHFSLQSVTSCLHGFAEYVEENSREAEWRGMQRCLSRQFIENKLENTYLPFLKSILRPLVGSEKKLRDCLINNENEVKETSLHYIASKCPWILEHFQNEGYIFKEDLQLKNVEGITVEAIGNKTNNSFSLLIACYKYDTNTALELLKNDNCLDLSLCNTMPLLHILIDEGPRDFNRNRIDCEAIFPVFQKLLAKGINPNLQNSIGENPLLRAINERNYRFNPFIFELLDYGADVDLANNWGTTPRKRVGQLRGGEIITEAILGMPHKMK